MKLKRLIEQCCDALQEAVNDGEWDADSYSAQTETRSGIIDLFTYRRSGHWEYEATIMHDNDHDLSNLESYLGNTIGVDWEAAEEYWREWSMDEYQRNGFASEADFWRWKEGR